MTALPAAVTLFVTAALLTLSLPARAQEPQQKIVIGGAQSVIPLAEQFSAQFRKRHPEIKIEIVGGGSNYAVQAAQRAEIDIGLISRSLSVSEKGSFHVAPFGHDAILILTHPGNRVGNLTLQQIRRIYLGEITNWREVGGEEQGIVPLTREKSSAIHTIFTQNLFGAGFKGHEKAFILRGGKEKVLKTIKRIEGVVGYGILRPDQAQTQGVKILAVEGNFPNEKNIRDGRYPLVRPHLVISHGRPAGLRREWIEGFVKFAAGAPPPENRP